jgi:uncharacterized surface protein with fasciclin (FAS1) repeats
MKRTISLLSLAFAGMLGCDKQTVEATPPPATTAAPAVVAPPPEPPAAPKKDSEKTVVDVAVGSPDHTTLVAAIVAAGLAPSLASPGGVYTVFAPTNAAFAKLPKGTVEDLLKPEKKDALTAVLKHHACVPIIQLKDMKDGQLVPMSDGQKLTLHVKDGKVMVENAHILGSAKAMNGIVHVIDEVLVPAAAK